MSSLLEQLPRDMLHEILQWLPLDCWVVLRMVSRTLHQRLNEPDYLQRASLPSFWLRDSASLAEEEGGTVLVPSPLLYRMADSHNANALFVLGMYYFFADNRKAPDYFAAYFAQTNNIYRQHHIIVLDAAQLSIGDEGEHKCTVLVYLHACLCFHARVALYFECECCKGDEPLLANTDRALIRASAIEQVLDRLHRYYHIYDQEPAGNFHIEFGHCTSDRKNLPHEYSISSTNGIVLDNIRTHCADFPWPVLYEHLNPYEKKQAETALDCDFVPPQWNSMPSSPTHSLL